MHQEHDGLRIAAAAWHCQSGPPLQESGAAHVYLFLCTLRIHQIAASRTAIWVQLILCARCSSSSRVLPGVFRSGHCIHAGVMGAKFVHLACAASTGLGLTCMKLDFGQLWQPTQPLLSSVAFSFEAEVILELSWCCRDIQDF